MVRKVQIYKCQKCKKDFKHGKCSFIKYCYSCKIIENKEANKFYNSKKTNQIKMSNKITRKPVPQTSTCRNPKCGQSFEYMRTMRVRWYCDYCVLAKNSANTKAWRARRREAKV